MRRLAQQLKSDHHSQRTAASSLHLTVQSSTEESTTISVTYLVPNACWRPWHTARYDDSSQKLEFATTGCIWQMTGEDWNQARITCSTERSSLGMEPPLLSPDLLETQPKPTTIVAETRDQDIQELASIDSVAPDGLPGVDDGGYVQTLVSDTPVTIPGDGKPHRIPLAGQTQNVSTLMEQVCYPELVEAAMQRTKQVHSGESPLLTGPVDLIRNGAYTGRTFLDYVAPGNEFELAWGPLPDVDVQISESSEQSSEANLLKHWNHRDYTVKTTLSNLGDSLLSFPVTIRIPVSEIEKVEVHLDYDETTPDADFSWETGFMTWLVTLEPQQSITLKATYQIRSHSSVVMS